MVDPDSSGLNEAELTDAQATQQHTFERHAQLQETIRGRPPSSHNALRGLDIQLTPNQADYDARADCLRATAVRFLTLFQREAEDLGADELVKFQARESLVNWVIFILSHDSGITLDRALVIVSSFIIRVVRHDADWQEFTPEFCASDACKRLVQITNNHPVVVFLWVDSTLAPFKHADFSASILDRHADWMRRDRRRVDVVYRNIVQATEADLEAIMLDNDSDATCAICLDEFEEHETALSTLPVQNWRCRGHKHWAGQACLVRFARTLHGAGMTAPHPRCPVCRTNFGEAELESDDAIMTEG